MMKSSLFRPVSLLVCVSFLGVTTPAPLILAQPATTTASAAPTPLASTLVGTAKADYDAGVLLFEDGDFAGALLKFKSAYDASSDPRLLWNMAVCQKQQRHYAKMLPLIEEYLAKGGASVTPEERAEAKTVLDTLQPFVGRLQIEANQKDSSVFVDDELVGTTPLTDQRVDMGERRIRVTKPEFVDWVRTISVQGGSSLIVTANLQPVRHVGILKVDTDIGGDIRVDGKLVGRGHWQGELPSGTHAIEVRAPGMQVYVGDAAVLDNQTNNLRVSLRPLPKAPEDQSHTPVWLWVAGGTLAAAGLGLGAYALFRPTDTKTAPPVAGTMEPGVVTLP